MGRPSKNTDDDRALAREIEKTENVTYSEAVQQAICIRSWKAKQRVLQEFCGEIRRWGMTTADVDDTIPQICPDPSELYTKDCEDKGVVWEAGSGTPWRLPEFAGGTVDWLEFKKEHKLTATHLAIARRVVPDTEEVLWEDVRRTKLMMDYARANIEHYRSSRAMYSLGWPEARMEDVLRHSKLMEQVRKAQRDKLPEVEKQLDDTIRVLEDECRLSNMSKSTTREFIENQLHEADRARKRSKSPSPEEIEKMFRTPGEIPDEQLKVDSKDDASMKTVAPEEEDSVSKHSDPSEPPTEETPKEPEEPPSVVRTSSRNKRSPKKLSGAANSQPSKSSITRPPSKKEPTAKRQLEFNPLTFDTVHPKKAQKKKKKSKGSNKRDAAPLLPTLEEESVTLPEETDAQKDDLWNLLPEPTDYIKDMMHYRGESGIVKEDDVSLDNLVILNDQNTGETPPQQPATDSRMLVDETDPRLTESAINVSQQQEEVTPVASPKEEDAASAMMSIAQPPPQEDPKGTDQPEVLGPISQEEIARRGLTETARKDEQEDYSDMPALEVRRMPKRLKQEGISWSRRKEGHSSCPSKIIRMRQSLEEQESEERKLRKRIPKTPEKMVPPPMIRVIFRLGGPGSPSVIFYFGLDSMGTRSTIDLRRLQESCRAHSLYVEAFQYIAQYSEKVRDIPVDSSKPSKLNKSITAHCSFPDSRAGSHQAEDLQGEEEFFLSDSISPNFPLHGFIGTDLIRKWGILVGPSGVDVAPTWNISTEATPGSLRYVTSVHPTKREVLAPLGIEEGSTEWFRRKLCGSSTSSQSSEEPSEIIPIVPPPRGFNSFGATFRRPIFPEPSKNDKDKAPLSSVTRPIKKGKLKTPPHYSLKQQLKKGVDFPEHMAEAAEEQFKFTPHRHQYNIQLQEPTELDTRTIEKEEHVVILDVEETNPDSNINEGSIAKTNIISMLEISALKQRDWCSSKAVKVLEEFSDTVACRFFQAKSSPKVLRAFFQPETVGSGRESRLYLEVKNRGKGRSYSCNAIKNQTIGWFTTFEDDRKPRPTMNIADTMANSGIYSFDGSSFSTGELSSLSGSWEKPKQPSVSSITSLKNKWGREEKASENPTSEPKCQEANPKMIAEQIEAHAKKRQVHWDATLVREENPHLNENEIQECCAIIQKDAISETEAQDIIKILEGEVCDPLTNPVLDFDCMFEGELLENLPVPRPIVPPRNGSVGSDRSRDRSVLLISHTRQLTLGHKRRSAESAMNDAVTEPETESETHVPLVSPISQRTSVSDVEEIQPKNGSLALPFILGRECYGPSQVDENGESFLNLSVNLTRVQVYRAETNTTDYAGREEQIGYTPLPLHEVALTEKLPHMTIPIGRGNEGYWKHNSTIRGIFDTGSGITIGYLPYWRSVARNFPELVEEFAEVDREVFPEPIKINGIEKDGKGSMVTHYISLWTPFVTQGNAVTLRIALTDNLSCTLIFGLPFIVRSKISVSLWESYASSAVFGTTFPLEYSQPEPLRDEAGPHPNGTLSLSAAVIPTESESNTEIDWGE